MSVRCHDEAANKTIDDPLIRNTRAFAQSAANPFYYQLKGGSKSTLK